jgi:osmotically inducible lipoprotein OsmB
MHTLSKTQAFGGARNLLLVGLATAVSASGCQTATGTGAGLGAAAGAGIGALAGHCPGAAVAGALLGTAVGGITGAAVDANRERKAENAAIANAAIRAPSLEDVVRMTQSAVPTGTIIEQIRTSGAVYRLSPDQVIWLSNNGVHPAVVQAMQDTAYRVPRRVYDPYYTVVPPPPVAVVEPVGVGVVVGGRGWR